MKIPLRIRELTGCGLAVAAGLVFMAMGGAPSRFLVVNAATLFTVGIFVWMMPPVVGDKTRLIIMISIIGLMALTLISGIEANDVRRWLPLGSLRLHAGMLLLPAFSVLVQNITRPIALISTTVIALTIMLQPDFASALALALSMTVMALLHRNLWSVFAAVISIVALVITYFNMVQLPPVAFVEAVITDAWSTHPIGAIALTIPLILAIIWPLLVEKFTGQACQTARLLFAACILGFAIASFVGPYPVPLLGYGASAIMGYGFAIALFKTIPGSQMKVNVS